MLCATSTVLCCWHMSGYDTPQPPLDLMSLLLVTCTWPYDSLGIIALG
jgi:hypothetical protein